MECNVGNQLSCFGQIASQYGGVYGCLLFGCIGIQFATQILQSAVDMVCSTMLGPFEQCVLGEMCQAVLIALLVARAGIDYQCTIGHIGAYSTMYSADSVG